MNILRAPKRKLLVFLFVVLCGLFVGLTFYFYAKYQKAQSLLLNPTAAAQEETKSITDQLGKLMILPANEEPTVATIQDINKLKDQPFFADAKNGDKVVIYTKGMKAILFRPSENKIINFTSINIGAPTGVQTQPTTQTAQPNTMVIYNGTTVVGLTQTFEKNLLSKMKNFSIVSRDNAKRNDYLHTLVVDLTGKKPDIAAQIANTMQGTVSPLPDGEIDPSQSGTSPVDFLVIVGKDFAETK